MAHELAIHWSERAFGGASALDGIRDIDAGKRGRLGLEILAAEEMTVRTDYLRRKMEELERA